MLALVTCVSLFVFIHFWLWLPLPPLLLLLQPPPPPPQLLSCSFIPRGEEQTPIITQVSVKWIIGRLIELLDGKHPSWVVRLSVLSLLPHLPAARAQGRHVHIQRLRLRKTGCGLWWLRAVAETREKRASGGEMELSQIPAGFPVNTNRRANLSNMMQNVVKRSNKSIKTPTVAAFGWVSSLDWIQTLTRKIFIFDPPKIPPHAPLFANSIHSNLLTKHGWFYIWRTTYTQ